MQVDTTTSKISYLIEKTTTMEPNGALTMYCPDRKAVNPFLALNSEQRPCQHCEEDDSSDDITNQETHDEPPFIVDALHLQMNLASRCIIPVLEEILARDEHSINPTANTTESLIARSFSQNEVANEVGL